MQSKPILLFVASNWVVALKISLPKVLILTILHTACLVAHSLNINLITRICTPKHPMRKHSLINLTVIMQTKIGSSKLRTTIQLKRSSIIQACYLEFWTTNFADSILSLMLGSTMLLVRRITSDHECLFINN